MDIRDAFGNYLMKGWRPIVYGAHWDPTALIPGPNFRWPGTPMGSLIACWKAFRKDVISDRRNGDRGGLVEPARWFRTLLRLIRVGAAEELDQYPWVRDFGVELCDARIKWIMRYPGHATPADMHWARRLRPDLFAREVAKEKKRMGVRSGIARVSHHNGVALAVPTSRLAWVAWPKEADSPEFQEEVRRLVGREKVVA
jgi:hypothetical protein